MVRIERQWDSLNLGGIDPVSQQWYLRSRIGMVMEALAENLPKYDEKDLMIINRSNDKGVWKSELWTLRDFEPHALILAPHSSQLKDCNLLAAHHAVVSTPKVGRGAHPEGKSLALESRGKLKMANKGSIDDELHQGNLYWIVGRTSTPKQANLQFEQVGFECNVTMKIPGQKKGAQGSSWASKEMPAIPLLVNKKAIKKHTMLMVYQVVKHTTLKEKESPKDKAAL